MDKLLTELINMVKNAAPALWAIARRQVLVESIEWAIGFVFFVGLCVLLLIWWKHINAWKRSEDFGGYSDDAEYDTQKWIIIAMSVLMACINVLVILPEVYGRLINPDYYAIYVLIRLVKPFGG